MVDDRKIELAKYRIEDAGEKLDSAEILLHESKYKDSVNRTYYAIFNSMRAVLALDGVDYKRHSGVIAHFRKDYIKTGIFNSELSFYIEKAFQIRNQSDYGDFVVFAKKDAEIQYDRAVIFYDTVKKYLDERVFN